jgi:hypothetical protein
MILTYFFASLLASALLAVKPSMKSCYLMSLTKIRRSPCHKFLDVEEPSVKLIVFLDQIMPLCQNLVLPQTKNPS